MVRIVQSKKFSPNFDERESMDLKKHSSVFSDDDPLSMVRHSMLYA
jgi:hypothetical protein